MPLVAGLTPETVYQTLEVVFSFFNNPVFFLPQWNWKSNELRAAHQLLVYADVTVSLCTLRKGRWVE